MSNYGGNQFFDYNNSLNNNRYHEKRDEEEIAEEDTGTIRSCESTLSLNRPFCKICHMGSSKCGDKLISPCKCSGTMQYIHCGCLLKWLEISNRTNEKPISCELCSHEYSWHKKFNYSQIRWPKVSTKDIFLHLIFVITMGFMLAMVISAIAPKLSSSPKAAANANLDKSLADNLHHQTSAFHHNSPFSRAHHNHNQFAPGKLDSEEKFMLLCAASFFVLFFLAIYVQTKTRDTFYSLVVKFLSMNQTFYITEYDHGQSNANSSSHNDGRTQQQHHHQQQVNNHSQSGKS